VAPRRPELAALEVVRRGDLEDGNVFAGTIASLCADRNTRNHTAVLNAVGLYDYRLAPPEVVCAGRTPKMTWKMFRQVFGGWMNAERPMGKRISDYMGNTLCPHRATQPFAPTRIGNPGVIFFTRGKALLEDTLERFHVFVDNSMGRTKTKLQYCGVYTKVKTPSLEVQVDEWHGLPERVSKLFPGFFRTSELQQCRAEPS